MSVPLTINGVTFQYPVQGDTNWGPVLTNWSTAVTSALVPLTGGFLTLSPNPSNGIRFANAANTGFLTLTVNGTNQLTFNGVPIAAAASLTNGHIFVGNVSNQAADVAMTGDVAITNAGVTTVAGLALLLPLTGGTLTGNLTIAGSDPRLTLHNTSSNDSPYIEGGLGGDGFLTLSGGTNRGVKLYYNNGSILLLTADNSNLTAGVPIAMGTNKITGLANGSASTDAAAFGQVSVKLDLSGGTMSGPINMGSSKITSLAQGTTNGEAIAFPAGTAQLAANAVTQSSTINDGTTFSTASYTTIASIVITSTGGPILLFATGSFNQSSSAAGIAGSSAVISRSGTSIAGTVSANKNQNAGVSLGSIQAPFACIGTETPAAGTYTYDLRYLNTGGGASTTGINNYSFTVVELKR